MGQRPVAAAGVIMVQAPLGDVGEAEGAGGFAQVVGVLAIARLGRKVALFRTIVIGAPGGNIPERADAIPMADGVTVDAEEF
jgi:hypothetical protein